MLVKLPAGLCGGHRDGEKVGRYLRRALPGPRVGVTQDAQRILSEAELRQLVVALKRRSIQQLLGDLLRASRLIPSSLTVQRMEDAQR